MGIPTLNSRIRICARDTCAQSFFSESESHEFCSPECREAQTEYATRNGRKGDPAYCPQCGGNSKVLRSLPADGHRRRRRWCKVCRFRWWTTESIVPEEKP